MAMGRARPVNVLQTERLLISRDSAGRVTVRGAHRLAIFGQRETREEPGSLENAIHTRATKRKLWHRERGRPLQGSNNRVGQIDGNLGFTLLIYLTYLIYCCRQKK